MRQVVCLNGESASLIDQGRLIVEQFREGAVSLGEARQFLNELRDTEEYKALAKASVERQAIDTELKVLNDQLVKLALEDRRQI